MDLRELQPGQVPHPQVQRELRVGGVLGQLPVDLQVRLLEDVLDASIAIVGADFGNVQLYDPASGALKIVAQRGFRQDFLDYFDNVHEGDDDLTPLFMALRVSVPTKDYFETFRLPAPLILP